MTYGGLGTAYELSTCIGVDLLVVDWRGRIPISCYVWVEGVWVLWDGCKSACAFSRDEAMYEMKDNH